MLAEAALMCLALNAYWEARNQDFQGMIAVNQVVMNRVESEYYPDTPCEVIMQGPTRPSWKNPEEFYPVRHKCQFSWYCDGKSDEVPESDKVAWDNARMAAFGVYYNQVEDLVDGSLWYHAHYVKPEWAKVKEIRAVVGDHIFYGWDR
jgi:spore germination cell wall hydrolase CwlJ-like protein